MVSWLAKATEVLRGAPPPEPEPYEVACVCTHRLSGMRQAAFQVVRCNRCGSYVFVLPRDVYPKPKPKPKKKVPKKVPPAIPGNMTPPPSAPGASVVAAGRKNAVGGAAGVAQPPPPAAPADAPAVSPSSSEIRIDAVELTSRGSLFTPVRLVACAILGVVVLTGYLVWQSQMKEKAALTLREHLEAGDAAFREAKYAEAATEYQHAAQAVDILGRDDAESRVVRQKAKELNAIAGLSPLSLYELCEEARVAKTSGDTKWGERFDRLYRDSWIIVEGDIVSDAGPDGTPQSIIRYPFQIEGAPVILDARLKALEPRSAVAGPQHVIFAGQLASFAEEGTKSKVWVLRLKDATAFLWVGGDTYRALGLGTDALRTDDETAHLLAEQGDTAGVKP
ncbi:MAG TPA: hypothetical protein VEI07_22605 [Planctomycetaceae bacterium]|nr:hypothetical protein [Planctomycetaceae bacterium]